MFENLIKLLLVFILGLIGSFGVAIKLGLHPLNDLQLSLEVLLQPCDIVSKFIIFFFDLHGKLNLLIGIAVTHLQHLILIFKSFDLQLIFFILGREQS